MKAITEKVIFNLQHRQEGSDANKYYIKWYRNKTSAVKASFG